MEQEGVELEDTLTEPFPFHPTMTPRGLHFYDTVVLNARQQAATNDFRAAIVREDNQYLAKHPEVRGLIFIFLRHLLKHPSHYKSITNEAAHFFSRPRTDIEMQVEEYMKLRGEPLEKEATSNVVVCPSMSEPLPSVPEREFSYMTFTECTEPETLGLEEWEAEPEHLGQPVVDDSTGYVVTHIMDYLIKTTMDRSCYEDSPTSFSPLSDFKMSKFDFTFTEDDMAVASPVDNTATENTSANNVDLSREQPVDVLAEDPGTVAANEDGDAPGDAVPDEADVAVPDEPDVAVPDEPGDAVLDASGDAVPDAVKMPTDTGKVYFKAEIESEIL